MDKSIKILLVDDEEDFRQLMAFWLESKGYAILTASNGQEAVKVVKNEAPDIIFLDLHMPVMDGVTALKEIRTFNKDVPVIVISAHTGDPKAREAMASGISGVFPKSNNFEEGLTLLESVLRTHKKLKDK
ncbi:MAG: response regulator [Omnitrophica bacterium]|nr:response regulator [Candidatus Omnitrophota bacterium]